MRLPLSWLLEYAAIDLSPDDDEGVQEMSRRLTGCGLEVESVERVGQDITGVVVAEVLDIEELTGFNKPIRYCQVSTGDGQERHVICGASNFAVGDRVALALPGAVLPGGFEIGARKTYGTDLRGHDLLGGRAGRSATTTPASWCCRPTRRSAPTSSATPACATLCSTSTSRRTRGSRCRSAGVARELAISYQVAVHRPGRCRPARRRRASSRRDVYPVSHRGHHRLRPVRGARGARHRPGDADAAGHEDQAGQGGPAIGVAAGRRDQLPDAGARPAAARLRPVPAHRADRGPAGPAGGAARDHRPRRPRRSTPRTS